jgi:hypothetical protein
MFFEGGRYFGPFGTMWNWWWKVDGETYQGSRTKGAVSLSSLESHRCCSVLGFPWWYFQGAAGVIVQCR